MLPLNIKFQKDTYRVNLCHEVQSSVPSETKLQSQFTRSMWHLNVKQWQMRVCKRKWLVPCKVRGEVGLKRMELVKTVVPNSGLSKQTWSLCGWATLDSAPGYAAGMESTGNSHNILSNTGTRKEHLCFWKNWFNCIFHLSNSSLGIMWESQAWIKTKQTNKDSRASCLRNQSCLYRFFSKFEQCVEYLLKWHLYSKQTI